MPAPRKGFTAAAPRPRCQPINLGRSWAPAEARPGPRTLSSTPAPRGATGGGPVNLPTTPAAVGSCNILAAPGGRWRVCGVTSQQRTSASRRGVLCLARPLRILVVLSLTPQARARYEVLPKPPKTAEKRAETEVLP